MCEPRRAAGHDGGHARNTGVLLIAGALLAAGLLAGCGQRGPLYLPDRNARVVTHASSAPDSAPDSTPATAPEAAPAATPAPAPAQDPPAPAPR